jgi:hypothetical protein
MGNTLIVTGSGPSKAAALQDMADKIAAAGTSRGITIVCQNWDVMSQTWTILAIASLDDAPLLAETPAAPPAAPAAPDGSWRARLWAFLTGGEP